MASSEAAGDRPIVARLSSTPRHQATGALSFIGSAWTSNLAVTCPGQAVPVDGLTPASIIADQGPRPNRVQALVQAHPTPGR